MIYYLLGGNFWGYHGVQMQYEGGREFFLLCTADVADKIIVPCRWDEKISHWLCDAAFYACEFVFFFLGF
jgi:hypothetical protein